MSKYPQGRFGNFATEISRPVTLETGVPYRSVGVKWYGEGVHVHETRQGHEFDADRFEIRTDDLIYNDMWARKGSVAVVPADLSGSVASSHFPTFELNRSLINPRYLHWFFKTPSFWDECENASRGSTGRNQIKRRTFLLIPIPLPPLAEQRRITAGIEELAAQVNEARTLRHKAVEEAEAIVGAKATATFRLAMKDGAVPLETVALLERGKFHHRPRNEPRFFGGAHPWIQIGEIESSHKYIRTWAQTLNNDGLAISKKFPRGTVLISIAATIGAVGILDFDCCIPDSIVGVTPRPDTEPEFLYHYLGYLRGHLEEIAPHSAQKNISLGILTKVPVPKLSLSEQRRIVVELDALQVEVDALKRLQAETAVELDALLPAILDRAFKGEL